MLLSGLETGSKAEINPSLTVQYKEEAAEAVFKGAAALLNSEEPLLLHLLHKPRGDEVEFSGQDRSHSPWFYAQISYIREVTASVKLLAVGLEGLDSQIEVVSEFEYRHIGANRHDSLKEAACTFHSALENRITREKRAQNADKAAAGILANKVLTQRVTGAFDILFQPPQP